MGYRPPLGGVRIFCGITQCLSGKQATFCLRKLTKLVILMPKIAKQHYIPWFDCFRMFESPYTIY